MNQQTEDNKKDPVGQHRGWEYERIGDYHRNLDPNWSYTPTYLRKRALVNEFMRKMPTESRVLDIACGEGVLVEQFRSEGYAIDGVDLNYESDLVTRGDVRDLACSDEEYDAVLFLDALEHLSFEDQPRGLSEIRRVLKPDGRVLLAVPNLAHLNSRFRFMFRGMLDRTDNELNHVGERPEKEYVKLLRDAGFRIIGKRGATFTVPYLYRGVICKHAARLRWLHDALEPCCRVFPSLSMLIFYHCRKA